MFESFSPLGGKTLINEMRYHPFYGMRCMIYDKNKPAFS